MILSKKQLASLHSIEAQALKEGDMRLFNALSLAISEGIKLSPQYIEKGIVRYAKCRGQEAFCAFLATFS